MTLGRIEAEPHTPVRLCQLGHRIGGREEERWRFAAGQRVNAKRRHHHVRRLARQPDEVQPLGDSLLVEDVESDRPLAALRCVPGVPRERAVLFRCRRLAGGACHEHLGHEEPAALSVLPLLAAAAAAAARLGRPGRVDAIQIDAAEVLGDVFREVGGAAALDLRGQLYVQVFGLLHLAQQPGERRHFAGEGLDRRAAREQPPADHGHLGERLSALRHFAEGAH